MGVHSAVVKQRGHRRTPEESVKELAMSPTQSSQQRNDVDAAALVPTQNRIEAFARRQLQLRVSEGHDEHASTNASNEGDDIHGCHRRRSNGSRARFSSARRTSPHHQELGNTVRGASHRRRRNTSPTQLQAEVVTGQQHPSPVFDR